jgi:hypothetical protein
MAIFLLRNKPCRLDYSFSAPTAWIVCIGPDFRPSKAQLTSNTCVMDTVVGGHEIERYIVFLRAMAIGNARFRRLSFGVSFVMFKVYSS